MDLQWLAIIPILSLLMLVHELGHFITARRAGVVVQEFGFGLPPRIFGYEYKGVIYSLNWIPFGAFVKMLGEEDPTAEGSFASKSKLTRSIILAAGSAMNFITAVVVFAIAYMTGWPTPIPDEVQIAEVAVASPAEAAGLGPATWCSRSRGRRSARSRISSGWSASGSAARWRWRSSAATSGSRRR